MIHYHPYLILYLVLFVFPIGTVAALGQAAGVAAHLAIKSRIEPRKVPAHDLQSILTSQGQVIRHTN